MTKLDVWSFQEILEECLYRTQSYSGRYMYGEKCLGVILRRDQSIAVLCADINDCILDIDQDREEIEAQFEVANNALRKSRVDNLGLDLVVYFPGIAYIGEERED